MTGEKDYYGVAFWNDPEPDWFLLICVVIALIIALG